MVAIAQGPTIKPPLILVGNRTGSSDHYVSSITSDAAPRRDYFELANRLRGSLVGYDHSPSSWYRWARRLEAQAKFDFVEAILASRRKAEYGAILSTSEKMAIPLSMISKLWDKPVPQIVIAHRLSSPAKTRLFHAWPLQRTFARVIVVCRSQLNHTVQKLGIPAVQANFVFRGVDQRFFRPLPTGRWDYLLAIGRERRDYATLLQAVRGTGLRLIVVSSSPWSSFKVNLKTGDDVTVLRNLSFRELRDLYAGARLVVLPLEDVDYAAGSTSLLETMAMAKPLVVSRSSGITDYVVDDETGVYVTPGCVGELRDALLDVWNHPQKGTRFGTNARQAVEEKMNLDRYVEAVSSTIQETLHDS